MAHYAKLDEKNFVIQVIVVNNSDEMKDGVESEATGVAYCVALTGHPYWKKTSYNNNIRGQYVGIGCRYDENKDIFIPPQPHPSWVLDDNSVWRPPVPIPQDENIYYWDESTLSWNLVPLPESSSDNGA